MSHLSRIKTRIADRDVLVAALTGLGYEVHEGPTVIRNMFGDKREVDLTVRMGSGWRGLTVGFEQTGGVYAMVADWMGRGKEGSALRKELDEAQAEVERAQRAIRQQYALAATREKLAAQGFEVVEEEKQADGQVRLLLRRMA